MALNKRQLFWITSLVSLLAVTGWVVVAVSNGTVGFPLDDGWIHQTYARSLARGDGWAYFPGQPSAGATAPLWVLLLTPGQAIGISPVCWVLLLGLIQVWGMGRLAVWMWPKLSDKSGLWPLAAGLAVTLEWHLLWGALSGMETLLMAILALGALGWLFHLEREDGGLWGWLALGALIGLGVWIRPEAVTLFGPVGFVAFLKPGRAVARLKRTAAALLGGLLLFGPYLVFNQWLAGTWWPNTFFAKQAEYAILREAPLWQRFLNQPLPLLAGLGGALLPGLVYSAVVWVRRRNWTGLAGLIWLAGFIGLYAVRLPVIYQHGRYMIPVMGVWVLWGLAGTAELTSGRVVGKIGWMLSRVWWAAVVILGTFFWWQGGEAFSTDVAIINGEMVVVSAWLVENTEPHDLIAAHDIGAIGYFAEREIVDLAGLVSPDVIPFIRDEARLAAYLDERSPDYLVTFPSWYPELVMGRQLVFQTGTAVTLSFGRDNMAVYLWGE